MLITAIFGLIGVALGGVVTAGVELFLRTRDASRQRQLAVRVMESELRSIRARLLVVMQYEGDVEPHEFDIEAAWEKHRPALSTLPRKQWVQLDRSIHMAATFPWARIPPAHWEGVVEAQHRALLVDVERTLAILNELDE